MSENRVLAQAGQGFGPVPAPGARGPPPLPPPNYPPPPYQPTGMFGGACDNRFYTSQPPPQAYMSGGRARSGGGGSGGAGGAPGNVPGPAPQPVAGPALGLQGLQLMIPIPIWDGSKHTVKSTIQEIENWCFVQDIEWTLKKTQAERDTEVLRLQLNPQQRVSHQKTFYLALHSCFKDHLSSYVSSPNKGEVDWASKLWEKIYHKLRPSDTVSAQQLIASLSDSIVFNGEIETYIPKIKGIMERLESLGHPQSELLVVTNVYQAIINYAARTSDPNEKTWANFISALRLSAPNQRLTLDLIEEHGKEHERHLTQLGGAGGMGARGIISFNASSSHHSKGRGPCSYCDGPHRFQDGCDQYAYDKKHKLTQRGRNEFTKFSDRSKHRPRDHSRSPRRTSFRRQPSRSPRHGSQSPRRSSSRGRSFTPNSRGGSQERGRRGNCYRCGSSKHWSPDCPFQSGEAPNDRERPSSRRDNGNRSYHSKYDRSRSRSRSASRSKHNRRARSYVSRHNGEDNGEKSTDDQADASTSKSRHDTQRRRVTIDETSSRGPMDRGSPHPHPTNSVGLMALESWARTKNFNPVGCFASDNFSTQIRVVDEEFNDHTHFETSNVFSNSIDSDSESIDNDPDIWPTDFYFLNHENRANLPTPDYSSDNFSSDAYSDPGLLWEGNLITTYPSKDPSDIDAVSLVSETSSDSESSISVQPTPSTAPKVMSLREHNFTEIPVRPSLDAWICNGDIPMDPRSNNIKYTEGGAVTYAFVVDNLDSFNRSRSSNEHWFIVDSGTNRHLCADERFIHRGEIISSSITGIGDNAVTATAHGPLLAKVTDIKGRDHDILSWGMFVPTSRVSLFSTVQALLAGNSIIHEGEPGRGKHGLTLRDKGTFVPFTWCPKSGLFWLPMKPLLANAPTALHANM